jgi:hypothetical protein
MSAAAERDRKVARVIIGGAAAGFGALALARACLLLQSTDRTLGIADLMALVLLAPGVLAGGAMGIDPDAKPLSTSIAYSVAFVFFASWGALWGAGWRRLALVLGLSSSLAL